MSIVQGHAVATRHGIRATNGPTSCSGASGEHRDMGSIEIDPSTTYVCNYQNIAKGKEIP